MPLTDKALQEDLRAREVYKVLTGTDAPDIIQLSGRGDNMDINGVKVPVKYIPYILGKRNTLEPPKPKPEPAPVPVVENGVAVRSSLDPIKVGVIVSGALLLAYLVLRPKR